MRLHVVKSKNAASLYMIESTYIGGKHSSRTVEKLGTEAELRRQLNGSDPYEWAKEYIAQKNREEQEGKMVITASFSPCKQIPKEEQVLYNGGYLFLEAIYHGLKLPELCQKIGMKHEYSYDLNAVLSRLIYTRILYPSSKQSSYENAKRFIEGPGFELHHIYRALDVIAREKEVIEEHVYQSSLSMSNRDTGVLYYDCTNYYFEIETENDFQQYGVSKEHRPNPIVQMGLFMDGSGIPLAMDIHSGAQGEQGTLKPIEERIAKDFALSKFVVSTDAGLGAHANRVMNDVKGRGFVVTQSLKKMKGFLIDWALAPTGWRIEGGKKLYNLSEIAEDEKNPNTYYKERWINENDLKQRLIVTFTPKYKAYQQKVRDRQIERAQKMVKEPTRLNVKRANDPARFVSQEHSTNSGEIAKRCVAKLNQAVIEKEERFDGFYGVCTNLEDDVSVIIQINKGRWEIEESFRVLKSEFRARPVYLSRENRIRAHFTTCFLALLVFRILEKKLGEMYTVEYLANTLREMLFYALKDRGYVPAYQRTELTDALHDSFGFRTDTEIIPLKKMKSILKLTKQR